MSTQIKNKLINKIQGFKDDEVLEEIYSWLEDESNEEIFVTSNAQKKAIKRRT
ncbi:MAG: hypothetical protein O2887_15200 [Bacteroidetes bacterium]|nr:hypothetical protein [Bacteroidota bacterium]MDA1121811.1 hypothetical protein [Bacteroidota bacterium]